jgi:hypothetical protein
LAQVTLPVPALHLQILVPATLNVVSVATHPAAPQIALEINVVNQMVVEELVDQATD